MVAEALPIAKRSEGQGWANLAIASGGRYLRGTGAGAGACGAVVAMAAGAGRSRNPAGADDAPTIAGKPYMEASGGERDG